MTFFQDSERRFADMKGLLGKKMNATECLTSLWMSHLTSPASAVVKRGNLTKNWPWAEPDDDPEFIAFMAKYGVNIPLRTLEQRLIPMEDA